MSHADVNAKITLENKAGAALRLAALAIELSRAGATLRRWMAAERTDGPALFAPNAIVAFGPDLAERFETTPAGEAPAELIEAARTINTFEDEHLDRATRAIIALREDEIRGELGDHGHLLDELHAAHEPAEIRRLLENIHAALQATGDVHGLAAFAPSWPAPVMRPVGAPASSYEATDQ